MIPKGYHSDWRWPFNRVPRSWTSFEGKPPRMLFGNSALSHDPMTGVLYPKPIPNLGQWWIGGPIWHGWTIPVCFAVTTKAGWHERFIARWDDVDDYWTFPSFTIKRVKS